MRGSSRLSLLALRFPAIGILRHSADDGFRRRQDSSPVVGDSGWERTVARALDESPRVRAWAKNHRLGFEIPYLHSGVAHAFIPDFLVDVAAPERADGVAHLVIEVKGLEREQDRSKDVGAARWIAAELTRCHQPVAVGDRQTC